MQFPDRIIFGDNQFFGINHMSPAKAQEQRERFKDVQAIIDVIDIAYDAGIHAFMFNTHDEVAKICDHFRRNPLRYKELRLYPSLPYAHKYANAVNEKGIFGALQEFVVSGRSVGGIVTTLVRGGKSLVTQDLVEIMKLLVDGEMRMFRGLNVAAVFLQNIVADLLLGLDNKDFLIAFAKHIRLAYGAEPGFNTMNMPRMAHFLVDCGLVDPLVCSSINRAGYLMSPNRQAYEKTLTTLSFRPIAMSIFASGAIDPAEAVNYIATQPKIRSVVFGASCRAHIVKTKELLDRAFSAPVVLSDGVPVSQPGTSSYAEREISEFNTR